jgi:uncharacterized membrane protein
MPILPVLYFILKSNVKPKKNIILGVTLPYDARQDADTLAVCAEFKKCLRRVCLILLPIPFAALFIPYWTIAITWHMTWLLAVIIAVHWVYAVYFGRLKRLKKERGWFLETSGRTVADIKAAAQPRKQLNAAWFAPPVLISLIPIIIGVSENTDGYLIAIYALNALLTVAFYLFYRLLFRQRSDVVDADTALSLALTRVRQYQWGKFWLGLSWFTGVYNICFWLFVFNMTLFIICTFVYTAVVLFVVLNEEFSARKAQEKLTVNTGSGEYLDDDKHWILGMFYYNPNDGHSMINDRVGLGMSINLAKPAGKILYGVAILALITMPLYGIWFIPEEFTPVRLEITTDSLEARHVRLEYEVPFNEIENINILETLPTLYRRAGTNTDTLHKGSFFTTDIKDIRVCLNPREGPYILVTASNGIYLLGDQDGDVTRAVYAKLTDESETR